MKAASPVTQAEDFRGVSCEARRRLGLVNEPSAFRPETKLGSTRMLGRVVQVFRMDLRQ
jgi:hypothetical protein